MKEETSSPRSRAAEEDIVRNLDDPRKDELVSSVVGFDLKGEETKEGQGES